MKKFWLGILTLFSLSTLAAAAQPDCKTLYFSALNLNFKTTAAFPVNPEERELRFLDEDQPAKAQTICGVSLTPDKKSQSLQMAATSWSTYKPYSANTLSQATGSELVLENFNFTGDTLNPKHRLVFDPVKRSLSYFVLGNSSFFPIVAGAKIDNGSVKPLYYKGKAIPLSYSPNNKIIDVYIKPDSGITLGSQHVSINLNKKSFTLFKKSSMPQK